MPVMGHPDQRKTRQGPFPPRSRWRDGSLFGSRKTSWHSPRIGAGLQWTGVGAMRARVFVTLKSGVLDPQGKAIGHALNSLGFDSVGEVRQGKVIDLELAETDREKASASIRDMCEKLLANTVIEKYEIEIPR